jgi:uncharacterized protein (DUF305 family)
MTRPFHAIALMLIAALTGYGHLTIVVAAEPAKMVHHHTVSAPVPFVATSDKSYQSLADDAMAVMNDGMARASMNGQADHDFASMMIPHHQGAVDMAKAELLYGTNPVLKRLAQEIIVTQGQEIEVMQLELKKHPAPASPAKP